MIQLSSCEGPTSVGTNAVGVRTDASGHRNSFSGESDLQDGETRGQHLENWFKNTMYTVTMKDVNFDSETSYDWLKRTLLVASK